MQQSEPLTLVRVHELLARDGTDVSYTTLRRWAQKELGFGGRSPTVRIDDPPPGEEAQVDFGLMGYVCGDGGKRRKLHVLIVTLPMSRALLGQGAVDRFKNNGYDLVVDGESYRSRLKPSIDKDGPPPSAPVTNPKPLLRRDKRACP